MDNNLWIDNLISKRGFSKAQAEEVLGEAKRFVKSEVSLEEIMEYIIEEEIDDVEYAVELIENQKDISWATDEDAMLLLSMKFLVTTSKK